MAAFWLGIGAIAGALGVAAGAFGAHGLKGRLGPEALAVFETAARYHLVHALALLATSWASDRFPGIATQIAGGCFLVGIVLFSGSLYALALTGIRALGAITPFGGAAFIAGWIALAWAALRER